MTLYIRLCTCGCNRPLHQNQRPLPYDHPGFETKLGWLLLRVWTDGTSDYWVITAIISLLARGSEGMTSFCRMGFVPFRLFGCAETEISAEWGGHGRNAPTLDDMGGTSGALYVSLCFPQATEFVIDILQFFREATPDTISVMSFHRNSDHL